MLAIDRNGEKLEITFDPVKSKSPDVILWKDVYGSHAQVGSKIYGDSPELIKVIDYLYELSSPAFDEEFAENYFYDTYRKVKSLGGCTAFRKGNFYARNYDWNYSNDSEFVIRTPLLRSLKGVRHKSLGVSNVFGLTENIVSKEEYSELYKVLPYHMVDGINDAHIVCNTNVVPFDKGKTYGIAPGRLNMCAMRTVRFILDNADSALDGVKKLSQYNIYGPLNLNDELHIMIADPDATYVVEFINNRMKVLSDQDDEYPTLPETIMTNFHLYGFNGNPVTCYYNKDITPSETTLEPHPAGVERYNIIKAGLNSVTDITSAMNLLESVKYTNFYATDPETSSAENPVWWSELVGDYGDLGDLNIYHFDSDKYNYAFNVAKQRYINRSRNDQVNISWQTMHSSVYDIENLTLSLCVQEDYSKVYTYSL